MLDERVAGAPAAAACRACAAALDFDQRYCLNCGELVAGLAPTLEAPIGAPAAVAVAATPQPRRRASTFGPLAALGGATLTGALLTALLIAALGGNNPQPIAVNVPPAKAPVVNVAAAGGAPAADTPFVSDWTGGDGWTVQLQVLPKSTTTGSAVVAAKSAATAAGAKDVGALDSDEHRSLEGGDYIVYSGVYRKKRAATAARRRLASKFAAAKVVRIADAPAPKAAKATTKKLEDLRKSSGDEFTEKSKKLPDSLVTPGPTAPKKDLPSAPADEGDTDVIG